MGITTIFGKNPKIKARLIKVINIHKIKNLAFNQENIV